MDYYLFIFFLVLLLKISQIKKNKKNDKNYSISYGYNVFFNSSNIGDLTHKYTGIAFYYLPQTTHFNKRYTYQLL